MTKWRTKSGGGREGEEHGMRAEERGGRQAGFMVAVMQKCKHFATFAENNDTAGRGRCARACVFLSANSACVPACVRVCGSANSTAGSGKRTSEVK